MKKLLRTPLLVSGWIALAAATAACDMGGDVVVEPLPPLRQPSPEARLGLPEIAGHWRFAGWVLPSADTATARDGSLVPGGELTIGTQRLDSIAGVYRGPYGRYPVVGEVRRDSVFTVVGTDANGQARVLAGHLERDTLWLELTTFPVADVWPFGTRAAFVRAPAADSGAAAPAPLFVRGPGDVDLLPPPVPRIDTLAADTLAPDAAAPIGAEPAPQRRPERIPIVAPPPDETPARREAPREQQQVPRPQPPDSQPRETPRRDSAARRDTARRDTLRIPTPPPQLDTIRPDTLVSPPPGPEVGLPPAR